MFVAILVMTLIFVPIGIWYQFNLISEGRNNVLFGITLPSHAFKEEEVLTLIKNFKKGIKKDMYIGVSGVLLMLLFTKVQYISIVWTYMVLILTLVIVMSYVRLIRYNKKIKTLKSEKKFVVENKEVQFVDIKATIDKNKKVPTGYLFLIPIIINIIYHRDITFLMPRIFLIFPIIKFIIIQIHVFRTSQLRVRCDTRYTF